MGKRSAGAVFRMFIALLAGAICIYLGAADAYIWFSGNKIDINTSSRSEYDMPSAAEGEVFVVQSVMTSEERFREFGIIPVKRKVKYYLITNLMRDDWVHAITSAEYGVFDSGFYTLIRVSDNDRIKLFDQVSDKTERYIAKLMKGSYNSAVPAVSIKINGKLVRQRTDTAYINARDSWLESAKVDKDTLTEYIISDEAPDKYDPFLALCGAAVSLIALIGIIVQTICNSIIRKKEKQKHLLY